MATYLMEIVYRDPLLDKRDEIIMFKKFSLHVYQLRMHRCVRQYTSHRKLRSNCTCSSCLSTISITFVCFIKFCYYRGKLHAS